LGGGTFALTRLIRSLMFGVAADGYIKSWGNFTMLALIALLRYIPATAPFRYPRIGTMASLRCD